MSKSREWDGFNPRLLLFLYDSLKAPILNYYSAVCGHKEWPKIKNLHLRAYKYELGVKSSTCLDGICEIRESEIIDNVTYSIDISKFYRRGSFVVFIFIYQPALFYRIYVLWLFNPDTYGNVYVIYNDNDIVMMLVSLVCSLYLQFLSFFYRQKY